MINSKIKSKIYSDDGSAMSILIAFLLLIAFLATASISLAKSQFTWASLNRQTSNSYQLARSGAEKIVDSMNKEIAKVLPRLMDEASARAHKALLADQGVKYTKPLDDQGEEIGDPYRGHYKGSAKDQENDFKNQYESELKKGIYNHIVEEFIPLANASLEDYEVTKSDVSNPDAEFTVETKIGVQQDGFEVEVTAQASQPDLGGRTTLTKSRILASISLAQEGAQEQLLEEYEWADAYPETIQSALISFGDFIINGQAKATVEGDMQVKGTIKPAATLAQAKAGQFPQPDEYGGIVISNGGNLRVTGNAMAVANIQTTNSEDKNDWASQINIGKDAIASSIAINDHYPDTKAPWLRPVMNNKITVGRNVFMDNDLRIDRYVQESLIQVEKSVFGISDGARAGASEGGLVYLDPNQSSGVYAMGRRDDSQAGSSIEMGRAFIAGQAYINFDDGNGYHRLFESVGQPFEDVYYLEDYREKEFGSDISYIHDFKDIIIQDKIKITEKNPNSSKPIGYAPGLVAAKLNANEDLYDIGLTEGSGSIKDQEQARKIFYKGIDGEFNPELQETLTGESDWNEPMAASKKEGHMEYKWGDVIDQPFDFYTGQNPFDKDYGITPSMYKNMNGYKGLQAYMLAKRGVFYKEFAPSEGSDLYEPKLGVFNDLVKVDVFDQGHKWTRNNPIEVISETDAGSDFKTIDISAYEGQPTALVSTDSSVPIILKAQGKDKMFTGVIISPGKLKIASDMTINGIVIAGNEKDGGAASRADIREGRCAGIQVSEGAHVTFKYDINDPATKNNDRDLIFKIRFMDKSLQRKLYDCLKMTNYGSASGDMDFILGANLPEMLADDLVPKPKVKLSKESVISSQQEGLQFVIKSLKKIEN